MKLDESYDLIKEMILEHKGTLDLNEMKLHDTSEILIRYYNLQGIDYLKIENADMSYKYLDVLYEKLKKKKSVDSIKRTFVSILLNYFHIFFILRKHNRLVDVANGLLDFQFNQNTLDRVHHTYMLMAMSFDQEGKINKAGFYTRKIVF